MLQTRGKTLFGASKVKLTSLGGKELLYLLSPTNKGIVLGS